MLITSRALVALLFVLSISAVDAFAQPPQRPNSQQGGPGGPREGGPGFGGPGGRQRGGPGMGGPGGPGGQSTADPAAAVTRMFTLDANKDGKLSKEEITDQRLFALGTRADANKDGNVTREELTALFTKEAAETNANRMQGGPGGPGGFGGPGNTSMGRGPGQSARNRRPQPNGTAAPK